MEVRPASIVCIVVVLALSVLCSWLLLDQAWLYCAHTDIDINSGDTRYQVRIFSLLVTTEIRESALSREIRRLGIAVSPTRAWKRTSEARIVNASDSYYLYGSVIVQCLYLLNVLDHVNASDEERRVILCKLMTSLQTGDAQRAREQAFLLTREVGDKHGLDVFAPGGTAGTGSRPE